MTKLELSLLNPNTLIYHRAGIAGLALALADLDFNDAPLTWKVAEDTITLEWECPDKEAVLWLSQQTYQIEDGYLNVPALNLDKQGKYTFSEGVATTFLQHGKQRNHEKQAVSLNFTYDENQPEITISFRPLLNCYYTGELKEAFSSKEKFKPKIPLKGHHLPGLVEDFANGVYSVYPEDFTPLLFLPLACNYYKLPNYRSAVVIPEVTNLKAWIKRRKAYPGRTYKKFRATGAGESGLRFLLEEQKIKNSRDFGINSCEVYQLGKQPWDGSQSYLKQAVYRVQVDENTLGIYDDAYQLFPNQVKKNNKGENWLAISKVLPWIGDNLVAGKVWHSGFFEFHKANQMYERKGLIKMTEKHLEPDEQVFFDAVQGAFSSYLGAEGKQASNQGREFEYKSPYKKVIYRLQRPSSQQEFASALIKFFSQNPHGNIQGNGEEIFAWLYRQSNWKKARDLALLAIVAYKSKKKTDDSSTQTDNDDELAEETTDLLA